MLLPDLPPLMARKPPADVCPPDLRPVFGRSVREARTKAGLTQGQLAEKTGLVGDHVSRIELGKMNVTLATMTQLAHFFGLEVSAMLQRPGKRPPD